MTDRPPRRRSHRGPRAPHRRARVTLAARMMEQGRTGLEEAFWAVTHTMFPEEARRHLKAATKEQLMAARSTWTDGSPGSRSLAGVPSSRGDPTRSREREDRGR